jgi:hypothetical protein
METMAKSKSSFRDEQVAGKLPTSKPQKFLLSSHFLLLSSISPFT